MWGSVRGGCVKECVGRMCGGVCEGRMCECEGRMCECVVKPWLRACSYFYEAQWWDTKSDPNNYIHRRLVMKTTSNPTFL